MGQRYEKYHMCLEHFLMIYDERGTVVILLQKSDHYSSHIVNHRKVFPYTNNAFYGAIYF